MFIDLLLIGTALGLALVVCILKRQAGTLLLALMSGALLANLGAQTCANWLTAHGFAFHEVPSEPAAGVALLLLPVIIGWFAGPKSKGKIRRYLGALIFGGVAATLLSSFAVRIFSKELVDAAKTIDILLQYQGLIVAVGIAYALLDLYISKARAARDDKDAKNHKK